MKKNMIVGIALAIGMLSVNALSASAASSCCSNGNCADKQIVQQFAKETFALSTELNTKDIELRELYSYDGIDTHKAGRLEAQIKELKDEIKIIAEKYGISACCLG